jgi:hypothetical protein
LFSYFSGKDKEEIYEGGTTQDLKTGFMDLKDIP